MGFNFGNLIGATGNALGLPELGISEFLGGTGRNGSLQNTQAYTSLGYPQQAPSSSYGVPIGSDTSTTSSSGPAAGSGTTGTSASNIGYLNDQNSQVDSQLGRLPQQYEVGKGNILGSYNSALTQLMNGKSTFTRDAGISRDQAGQDYNNNIGQVNQGVHTQTTNLQRLLGAHGAGNSSAAQILAPYAAALQGNQQHTGLDTGFARNNQALDNSLTDYNTQYDQSYGDLGSQRDNQLNGLLSNQDQTRANLLTTKGNIASQLSVANGGGYIANPYRADINGLTGQVDALGKQAIYNPKAITTQNANIDKYQVNSPQAAAIASGIDPSLAQGAGAYYSLLSGQDKTKRAQLLGA